MRLTDYFKQVFAYNVWANRRIWAAIEQLSDEQFDAPNDFSIGSLHIQVAHLMSVEFWWFNFLSTGQLVFVADEEWADRAAIRRKWDEAEVIIRAYLDRLTDEELNRLVKPDFWKPDAPPYSVAEAILQVFNHSTDHRAQIGAALHRVGGPAAPQDYLFFHFDRAGIAWTNE